MSQPRFFGPDPMRARLRTSMATLDRQIRRAQDDGLDAALVVRLRESFEDVSSQLALGPEPETRACPTCGCIGMRSATVCGNCWTRLGALGEASS